jgi:hypothetical protein
MAVKKEFKERKMKKFSWIFALILALSIGFIGCPAPDEPPAKTGGSGGDNETPFVPNENAAEIAVTFTSENTLWDAKNGDVDGSVDIITGGYKYTYSTVDKRGYGNAVVRVQVDLGKDADDTALRLGDFGGVALKWQGISGDVGLSPADPTYTKNLFVLASDEEGKVSPYLEDEDVMAVMLNTKYYETNPSAKLYAGAAGVPGVKGKIAGETEPYSIATPILRQLELTGSIWLAFYMPAEPDGGIYQITDVKLIPAASFTQINPPSPPPPPEKTIPEVVIPAGLTSYTLDLEQFNKTNNGLAGGTTATTNFASGKLTAVFTKTKGMRVSIDLTTAAITAINARVNDKIYVEITGTATGDGKFRYHIGDVGAGSSWNASNGSNNFQYNEGGNIGVQPLDIILKKPLTISSGDQSAKVKHFILQQDPDNDGTGDTTLEITSIKIYLIGVADKAVSFTSGDVTAIGGTVDATGADDYTFSTTNYGQGSTFKVTLPVGAKLSDYTRLDLTFEGLAGDTGYKNTRVAVSATAITAVTESGYYVASAGNGVDKDADGKTPAKSVTIVLPAPDSTIDINEIYVAIYVWSGAATWKISGIKFHN